MKQETESKNNILFTSAHKYNIKYEALYLTFTVPLLYSVSLHLHQLMLHYDKKGERGMYCRFRIMKQMDNINY